MSVGYKLAARLVNSLVKEVIVPVVTVSKVEAHHFFFVSRFPRLKDSILTEKSRTILRNS